MTITGNAHTARKLAGLIYTEPALTSVKPLYFVK